MALFDCSMKYEYASYRNELKVTFRFSINYLIITFIFDGFEL